MSVCRKVESCREEGYSANALIGPRLRRLESSVKIFPESLIVSAADPWDVIFSPLGRSLEDFNSR